MAERPNVLYFIVDQWNHRCFGYADHPVVQTPNLDRLREEAVRYSRCYVQNAFCLPSRISYLTGQYLCHHREYGFSGLLDEGTPSMPAFFRDHGYETMHVGKAHVDPMIDQLGFETFIPTLPEDIPFATDINDNYQAYCRERGIPYPNDQVHGGDGLVPVEGAKGGAGSGAGLRTAGRSAVSLEDSIEVYTSRKAIEFLERDHDQPFFLHVSFDRPHLPISPPAPYDAVYDPDEIPVPDAYTEDELARLPEHIQARFTKGRDALPCLGKAGMQRVLAHYYGLMTLIDHEIGSVLQALRDSGKYDDTVIVFCADHGDFAGYKGLFNKYSNTIYHDEIVRTPMLVKYPKQVHAGEQVSALTEAIDVFPTLAATCGLEASHLPLDGDALPTLAGGDAANGPERVAFSEAYGIKTLIKGNYKLITYINSAEGELYDLARDPYERVNLYAEPAQRDKVVELKLEIVKKLTTPPSSERQAFIRSLFDDARGRTIGAMAKMYKWDKAIIDGGGFWMVCRDSYRLVVLPFDDEVRLDKLDPNQAIPVEQLGWVPCDDPEVLEHLLDELIDVVATKVRPISLMSGGQKSYDNLLHTKGRGYA